MPDITITISGTSASIDKYDENEEGFICPLATRDEAVQAENKEQAQKEAQYRDPADGGAFRADETCLNCACSISEVDMEGCLPDDESVRYCHTYQFMCDAGCTCDKWMSITDNELPEEPGNSRDVF